MYCHSNNVFHRDLKPANIVVDKNNICKLIDFGMRSLHKQSWDNWLYTK